jgi:hypothetical protein
MEEKANNKALLRRIAIGTIVASVAMGAVAISGVAEVADQSTMATRAFIYFMGAIIVVQVIPGLMLIGAILNGIVVMIFRKVPAPARVVPAGR